MYVFREDNLQIVHIQTNPQKNSLQFHRNEGMADQRNELSHFPISVFSVTIIAIGSELNGCIFPCQAYVESATHDCTTMKNFTKILMSLFLFTYQSLDFIDVQTLYIHVTIGIQNKTCHIIWTNMILFHAYDWTKIIICRKQYRQTLTIIYPLRCEFQILHQMLFYIKYQ